MITVMPSNILSSDMLDLSVTLSTKQYSFVTNGLFFVTFALQKSRCFIRRS